MVARRGQNGDAELGWGDAELGSVIYRVLNRAVVKIGGLCGRPPIVKLDAELEVVLAMMLNRASPYVGC